MRRLIVNADDFGLTAGVNRAILEAHRGGIVTSATLMANSRAFAEAAELARSAGDRLSVGCHIVLLDGEPMLPPDKVPTLLQRANHGRLRDSLNDFAIASLRHKLQSDEIEAEALAQIERIQRSGIAPSTLTSTRTCFRRCFVPCCGLPHPAECGRCAIHSARSGPCR